MTYALIAVFLATGKVYIEQRHLTLAACAGRLALLRTATHRDLTAMRPRIGEVQYRCIPEGEGK